ALAAAAYSFSLLSSELAETDGAGKLFTERPTGRDGPLDSGTYRFVAFGHTHEEGEVGLPNGARYFNTGAWVGRARTSWPVLVVEEAEAGVRACLGSLTGDRIRTEAWRS